MPEPSFSFSSSFRFAEVLASIPFTVVSLYFFIANDVNSTGFDPSGISATNSAFRSLNHSEKGFLAGDLDGNFSLSLSSFSAVDPMEERDPKDSLEGRPTMESVRCLMGFGELVVLVELEPAPPLRLNGFRFPEPGLISFCAGAKTNERHEQR